MVPFFSDFSFVKIFNLAIGYEIPFITDAKLFIYNGTKGENYIFKKGVKFYPHFILRIQIGLYTLFFVLLRQYTEFFLETFSEILQIIEPYIVCHL